MKKIFATFLHSDLELINIVLTGVRYMVELYYLPHLTIATPASNVEIYSDYESLLSVVLSWVFLTNTQTRQDQQQHCHTCGGNHTELRAEDRVAP